jgi:membrane protease YdiL (CAAX protease family)
VSTDEEDPDMQTTSTTDTPQTGTRTWLTFQRNQGRNPAQIADQLVDHGWSADEAAKAALGSLRSSDRQPVLWFALCWAAGLAGLGFGTAAHQLLMASPNRSLAAISLTLGIVMAPIAVGCSVAARRIESSSPFAVWSPERRMWFGTLALCTAVVGLVRLITYLYLVISAILASPQQPLYGTDLAHVVVSLGLAIPLFWWSFGEWRRSNVVLSGLPGDRIGDGNGLGTELPAQ